MKNLFYLAMSILISCTLMITSSCDKQEMEPELVPITTSGENTMGFYVDGKPFNTERKYDGTSWCSCGVKGSLNEEGIVYILASGDEPKWTMVIYFHSDSLDHSNEITINESTHRHEEIVYRDDSQLGGRAFTCDSLHHGEIKISRMDDQVLAGTFEFKAIHEESGETIQVTDGRFDIKLD